VVNLKEKFRFCKHGHDTDIVGRGQRNACSECRRIRHRAYYKGNTEKVLSHHRSRKRFVRYGLNEQTYDELLSLQNNVCAICGGVSVGRSLSVDHCHKTGKIRGLLCQNCNLMLGYAKDKIEILLKATEYLKL
jgi:hypothetical protein